ncbi:MAG: hypothetical protein J6W76_08010, partial [Spirochaetales bacterium]|nr:hypothetical protein [Spirochaetales bacterium]
GRVKKMAAFILVMSNIIIMIVGYLIINYLLKKRYINEEILNQIKTDISNMIRQMNEITERNVELVNNSKTEMNALVSEKETQVTEMLLSIEKKIRIIDDRMKQLKSLSPEQAEIMKTPVVNVMTTADENNTPAKTYNYIDVINRSNAAVTAKKQAEDEEKKKQKELENKLASMEISDRIGYLSELGKSNSEIKKMLGVSDGEIELSLSLYKTRRQ